MGTFLKKGDLIRITNENALAYIQRRHGIKKDDIGIIVWSYDLVVCKAYFPRVKKVRSLVRAWIEIVAAIGE